MLNNTNTAIVVNERVSFSAYNENIHQVTACLMARTLFIITGLL